jgi:hypothetical protein
MKKVAVGLKLWESGNSSNHKMLTMLLLVFLLTSTQLRTIEQLARGMLWVPLDAL